MGPRVTLLAVFVTCLSITQAVAGDHDPTTNDLKGIPKSHRYAWAVLGGTALGAGIGVVAPGGAKSGFKGALIGGSLTSAIYLAKNPRAAEGHRPLAHIITNTALGTGVFWTVCNCGDGAWAGALVGGGVTAVLQAFGHHSAIAQSGGTSGEATAEATTASPDVVNWLPTYITSSNSASQTSIRQHTSAGGNIQNQAGDEDILADVNLISMPRWQ